MCNRHREARKVMAATEEELDKAEAVKDRLCSELNLLVQQSARIQLQKLEQLTDRLEQLHVGSGELDPGCFKVHSLQLFADVFSVLYWTFACLLRMLYFCLHAYWCSAPVIYTCAL